MIFFTCSYHSEHGFWPTKGFHPTAVTLAQQDHPRNPKYARMMLHKCLICGSHLVPIEREPSYIEPDTD